MKQIYIAVLLLIFAGLACSSMMQKSGTCDEVAHHIAVGYSYFKTFDFRLNPYNPPLPRYLMAFPLNFINLKALFSGTEWEEADAPKFSQKFFFEYNRDKFRTILFLSRLMIVFVGIFAAILVYKMASDFYGGRAGLFALFIFCFTPEIIAHSSLATTDMTFACFSLLSIFSFWKFSKNPTPKNILFASISLGLAQLAKYTSLLLYPVFLSLIFIEHFRRQPTNKRIFSKTILIFMLSVIVIWAGYGFTVKSFLAQTVNQEKKINFAQKAISRFVSGWDRQKTEHLLRDVKFPLTTYLTGIFGVAEHTQEGHNSFFWGKWSQRGNRWYYFVTFFIKTPLPILIIFCFSLFSLYRKPLTKDELYIVIPGILIFLAASFSKLQIGIRYILPVYLLLCIFISRMAASKPSVVKRRVAFLLGAWIVIVALVAWPNYLSYFNEFIGGSDNGWKYLRDSNIDWGQDLPALSRHLKQNNIKEIKLKYFGEDNPEIYGINFSKLEDKEYKEPLNEVYAISAQHMDSVAWAKETAPKAKAGYSIFIYDFRE
ncbi:MAG: glycosyltransferase family 39 protein [Candidatus Omnitrophota bacterium]|jgi:hypothetical protein